MFAARLLTSASIFIDINKDGGISKKNGAGDITNVAYLNKYPFYSPSCALATLLYFIAYMSSLMFCGLVWVHTTDDYIDRAVPEQVVIPSVVHRLRYC